MITLLPISYKSSRYPSFYKTLLLVFLELMILPFAAFAQNLKTTLPAQIIVCAGTAGITLQAAADHPNKDLEVQWQTMKNGTWVANAGADVSTTFSRVNSRNVTTTTLHLTDFDNAQQVRLAFGVNSVDPQTASAVTVTNLLIPAAAFTLPATNLYANEPALFTFSGAASSNATYNWTFAPGATFATGHTAQTKNPVVSWSTPGEKKITLTLQDGSCQIIAEQTIKVYGNYTWTGGANSSWLNAANWSANAIPGDGDDVTIASAPFLPELSTNATIRNLTVQSGSLALGVATLTVNGNATFNGGSLSGGTVILNGNLETNTPGVFAINQAVIAGNTAQVIKSIGSGSLIFNDLTINKPNHRVTLETSVTVNNTLNLKSGNKLQLGNNNLIIGATGQILAENEGYVLTNGTGTLQMTVANNNSAVFFPVGNHSYNPVKIKQSVAGTTDIFKVRVQGGLFDFYGTDNTGVEHAVEDGISRTWVIEEAVNGGSEAQVTLQFSANNTGNDWAPSFTLEKAIFAHYSTFWEIAKTGKPMLDVTNNKMMEISHNNLTSFRIFGIFNNDHEGLFTLPVELLSFSAARVRAQVELKWSTASEKENDFFSLEQSTDGYIFKEVTQVKGAGNSNRKLDYHYSHKNAPAGLTYYRLKQTDFNGTFTYSKIVAVNNQQLASTVIAYPNPSAGSYQVAGVNGVTLATVVDATGRPVKILPEFNKDNSFDLTDQKAGIYFLHLHSESEVKTVRLVKQ